MSTDSENVQADNDSLDSEKPETINLADAGQFADELIEHFREQRSHIGKGHGTKNESITASKKAMSFLEEGRLEEARASLESCANSFDAISEFNLPISVKDELHKAAGQEFTEAVVIFNYFTALIGKIDPVLVKIPTDRELNVPPSAWLGGITDATSEISKMLPSLLINQVVADEKALYERALNILETLHSFLLNFRQCYARVINNHYRPGQGFLEKLRQPAMAILRIKERLISLKEKESLNKKLDAILKASLVNQN